MKLSVSVFGLGYVGVVSAACLAKKGHVVVGIDIDPCKVELINKGETPIVENQLGDLLKKGVTDGLISATTDPRAAVLATDISIVCVGTPSLANGNLNVQAVETVCRQIGEAIKEKGKKHTVVIRSTVLPGTLKDMVLPALEAVTGGKVGERFGLAHNPEFLREGTAVYDFFNPPKTVVGCIDDEAGKQTASLYDGLDAPLIMTTVKVSEMVKYVDNVWHGLKVCFGNEIGNICKAQGIDSHKVMDIFCQDTKLNLSPYYLKPGFAFGGSCLPKDTRALNYRAKELDLKLPLLSSIMESNQQQIERAVRLIMARGKKKISMLGFSFKAGTDDLRESPIVEVIERLLGKGYDLKLYDSNVSLAMLSGANKEYILNTIPHISSLVVTSLDEVMSHGDVIVIGNGSKEFESVPGMLGDNQELVDFVRLQKAESLGERYEGINWEYDSVEKEKTDARSDDSGELARTV